MALPSHVRLRQPNVVAAAAAALAPPVECAAEGEVDYAAGGEPNDEEDGDRGDGILAVAVIDTHRQPDECVSEKSGRGTEGQRVDDGLHGHKAAETHVLLA